MTDELKAMLPKSLLKNLIGNEKGEIGILRLLPKALKLKYPSFEFLEDLTSRGIKSSIKDPINTIASILAEVSKTLYTNLKNAFKEKFGIDAPPKKGRLKQQNF